VWTTLQQVAIRTKKILIVTPQESAILLTHKNHKAGEKTVQSTLAVVMAKSHFRDLPHPERRQVLLSPGIRKSLSTQDKVVLEKIVDFVTDLTHKLSVLINLLRVPVLPEGDRQQIIEKGPLFPMTLLAPTREEAGIPVQRSLSTQDKVALEEIVDFVTDLTHKLSVLINLLMVPVLPEGDRQQIIEKGPLFPMTLLAPTREEAGIPVQRSLFHPTKPLGINFALRELPIKDKVERKIGKVFSIDRHGVPWRETEQSSFALLPQGPHTIKLRMKCQIAEPCHQTAQVLTQKGRLQIKFIISWLPLGLKNPILSVIKKR
jgi:hypothetical protein